MKQYRFFTLGLLLFLTPAAAFAALSAQDADISVYPVVRNFPVTTLGSSSTPALFTITNQKATALSIGPITLGGVNATEFQIAANGCPASLDAGTSCTVSVSFAPQTKGSKSAELRIASGAANTPVLTAFLTNVISTPVEAQQRMPAVLSSVTIPDTMTAGTTYTLSWTLEGYNAGYSAYAVMFDCTGISDGSCGNNYTDTARFAESADMAPASVTPGNWAFNGVGSQRFTYNWSFTPNKRSGNADFAASPGTDVVVRFYLKSDIDAARQNDSVSLLIPGNQATTYYDTAGRRILKKIVGTGP